MKSVVSRLLTFAIFVAGLIASSIPAAAHCDTMNGPVVASARQAIAAADVTPVLKWVKPEYEPEVRTAFGRTLRVRPLSAEARELADQYFFETAVRLHRAGEGEPYTGLKNEPPEPVIAKADAALESGDLEGLVPAGINKDVADSLRARFARVQATKLHADDSIAAGREYVAAYVDFMHHVEEALAGENRPEHFDTKHAPARIRR